MRQVAKYLHHETSDYDFVDDDGKRVAGTSHKLWVWHPGQAPVMARLEPEAMMKFEALGLKPSADVELTYGVSHSANGRARLGKVIAVDAVTRGA